MINQIIHFDHPNPSELNKALLKIVHGNLETTVAGNPGGRRTDWNLHEKGIKEIDILHDWIRELIPKAVSIAHTASEAARTVMMIDKESNVDKEVLDDAQIEIDTYPNFDQDGFKIHQSWGIYYNKGEGVELHNHFPYTFTACYYVNIPEGSAPIIMEGEELSPVAGRVVFFPGHLYHEVVPAQNHADGRCAIPSNIVYSPFIEMEEYSEIVPTLVATAQTLTSKLKELQAQISGSSDFTVLKTAVSGSLEEIKL